MADKGKEKAKKVSDKEARELIRDYFVKQNRPYSKHSGAAAAGRARSDALFLEKQTPRV